MRLLVLLLLLIFFYDASLVWAAQPVAQKQIEQGEAEDNSDFHVEDAVQESATCRSIVRIDNLRQFTALGIAVAHAKIVAPVAISMAKPQLFYKSSYATSAMVRRIYPEGVHVAKVAILSRQGVSQGVLASQIKRASARTILGSAAGVTAGIGLSIMITAVTSESKEALIRDIMITVISEVIAFALTKAIITGIAVGCVNPPAGLALFAMELVLETVISTATTAILYVCLKSEDF
ncbi:MAG: hypothetical protein HUU50_18765 [Candidatus Brocadiae bacterium]|nr:hypothetical protein [Candidatus Brocadiia bacterium]